MEIIKQICEMCRYKNQSNATFPCVDCCSRDRWELAETIVVSSKDIEAQQQEINKFRTERDMEVSKTNKLYAEIRALTADKDEQAGRLMKMDYLLRRTLPILEVANDQQELIADIDALLGGNDDAEKPQT